MTKTGYLLCLKRKGQLLMCFMVCPFVMNRVIMRFLDLDLCVSAFCLSLSVLPCDCREKCWFFEFSWSVAGFDWT